ncbi:MAG: hypothetical protein K0R54_134 [Clostridiaceae bacterium]|nr:hypothetical protein [Clostridiaceae bacterium]
MKRAVAIDSGKFATKAITKDSAGNIVQLYFRTKMDDTNEKLTTSKESYVVEFQGKRVLIGKQAEAIDYDKDKTKILHKIAIFTAISQLVDDGDTVKIAVGCPMDLFNNFDERQSFSNFLTEDKKVNLIVNNKPFSFTLEEAKIFPESSGIILRKFDYYKDRLIGVVDIGGLNVNACVYDRGDILKNTCFTLNRGGNVLLNDLRLHLNQEFKSNLQEWQMETVIKDGFIRKNPEESKKVISKFLQDYVDEIMKEAKKRNWDIDNMDFIFIGGSSLLLNEEIKIAVPHAEISKNAIWDNVEGFGFVVGL